MGQNHPVGTVQQDYVAFQSVGNPVIDPLPVFAAKFLESAYVHLRLPSEQECRRQRETSEIRPSERILHSVKSTAAFEVLLEIDQ